MKENKAIVIGAGIAGLASAVRLKLKGYQVQVFEQNNYPGGKLTALKLGDYRFDAGPSLFTQPYLVDELFELAGKNPSQYFRYQKLNTLCHYFYEDGTTLKGTADKEVFAKEIEQKLEVDKNVVTDHLAKSEFIYTTTAHLFLDRSLHQWSTYLRWRTLMSFLKLPFIGVSTTLNEYNTSQLKHPKLVQLFNRYATYNGSDPYKAPGTLHVIPHLEFNEGAYLPTGGMQDISLSIYKLAQELGVEFIWNAKVNEILHQGNRVTGVLVDGNVYDAAVVVCNMDVALAYKNLLPGLNTPQKIKNQERSSSALIFYWAIDREFPELDLHNILFSADYQKEFHHLFDLKTIDNDPTVYINITSKKVKGDAPKGAENWFVMINVPANDKSQDWDGLIEKARTNIKSKINRILKTDIDAHILNEEILEPRTIESKTSSYQGSLYGTSSNSKLAAFFRQNNKSSQLKNLYFIGGSVHPGGGIPLALRSAKIVDELIKKVKL